MTENVFVHTVNGHKYHDVEIMDEQGYPVHLISLVETPRCELQDADHICANPCTEECKCAQNLFIEIN